MVGQNIGKYRVLERVGRGGMGTVYRAIDETLHREVAIKVLNAELNDPEVAKRFRAEAITVARLSHPGIATIYELFQHEGQWLMVMEFVRGETIEHMVERMGPLSPQRSAELCMQALAALAHAHSMGVVHRDLKPANIMITETGAIKIMDFGIARVAGTEHLTSAGFMMGTPSYMAPEQVMGREIDARADLYAMGVVFYRLTTAKLPFRGDTPFSMAQSQVNDPPTPIGTFRADLPPWVEQVVVRSLAKNPEERFQSAVEFHEAFARCLAGLPMASLYSSSAPTELLMTPPRAMPTGAFQRTIASTTLPLAQPAVPSMHPPPEPTPAAAPVVVASTATPAATPSPMPAGHAAALTPEALASMAPTIMAVTPLRTASAPQPELTPAAAAAPPAVVATPSVPVPVPVTPAVAVPAGAAPKKPGPAAKKGGGAATAVAVVAAVIVLAAIGGALWYRAHRRAEAATDAAAQAAAAQTAAAQPAVPAAPPPDAAAVPVPVPEPAPAADSTAAAPVQPVTPRPVAPAQKSTASSVNSSSAGQKAPGDTSGSSSARASAAGVSGATSATPASASTTPVARSSSSASSGNGPSRSAPIDDTAQAFTDVKVLTINNGHKTNDEDVVLSFSGGQISILPQKDLALSLVDGHVNGEKADANTPINLPYRSILQGTYVHARDPKWSADYVAPPNDLDVGGMLRGSRHFLVLQTKDSYVILRLDDSNVLRILQTVEARTGLTIDRPQQADKPQGQ